MITACIIIALVLFAIPVALCLLELALRALPLVIGVLVCLWALRGCL